MRVGQPDQLVEVGGDQQHRQARCARGSQLVPHRGLRTDVDTAGRVRGDAAGSGSLAISRPTISFCWLPPDSAKAGTSMLGVRTSNRSTDVLGRSRACRSRSIQKPWQNGSVV